MSAGPQSSKSWNAGPLQKADKADFGVYRVWSSGMRISSLPSRRSYCQASWGFSIQSFGFRAVYGLGFQGFRMGLAYFYFLSCLGRPLHTDGNHMGYW